MDTGATAAGGCGGNASGAVDHQESSSSGQSRLAARGHWRPAEDAKLRELVALYGPQNWNLIAEKLDGRSGTCVRLYLGRSTPSPRWRSALGRSYEYV
jgi:myb proto-oncogene protein